MSDDQTGPIEPTAPEEDPGDVIEQIEPDLPEEEDTAFEDTSAGMLMRVGTDASKWTDEFCKLFGIFPKNGEIPSDEVAADWAWGVMVGWFANAIEVGRSAGHEAGRNAHLSETDDIRQQLEAL